jgi:integrase/recombinase XerD
VDAVVVVVDVSVSGPLEQWAEGFVRYLFDAGYAPTSIGLRVRLFAHVSRWCGVEHVTAAELDSAAIDRFLVARQKTHTDMSSAGQIAPLLWFLRSVGAIPPATVLVPVEPGPVDAVLDRWVAFLVAERALKSATASYYRALAVPFVVSLVHGNTIRWDIVDAKRVAGFVAATIPQLPVGSAKLTITVLRSLLRYLFSSGLVSERLDAVVPARAGYRGANLPRGVSAENVAAMIATTEGDSAHRRRDRAVLLLLSRLALRAQDLARVELDDVDWRAGTIRIRGKGGQIDLMPLPADVGTAVAEHLRGPRPSAAGRAMFFSCRAPGRPLATAGIRSIVQKAAGHTGLGAVGAHRLRHTVATTTINAGASLEEVGQLLRHRGLASTTIYAKVDLVRLSSIARPWPGSVALPEAVVVS